MHSVIDHLILVSGPEMAAEDRLLLKSAAAMGISTTAFSIPDGSLHRIQHEFQPRTYCLAMSDETLAALHQSPELAAHLQTLIENHCATLLIFGCNGSAAPSGALPWLTAGAVSGILPLEQQQARFTLPHEARSLSRQLAGLGFPGGRGEEVSTFDLPNATANASVIMKANECPMFVLIQRQSCQIFLLAGRLPDLDEPMSRDRGLEEHYDRLIPILIFLRYCFGQNCWHGSETTARLIIDDPVLTGRYGFLEFELLMDSMRTNTYGTSIAFIPWNYWRTSRRNVSRLLGESSNLAICIHGCDHTNKEFEARDAVLLGRKAALAVQRMESQQKRTGAAFDQVMVFPQGLFSRASIPALRANNYLAAVNTTCFPTDFGPDDLKVGDFFQPAITRYDGFPIFPRRYPRRLFDFAFDLFLGRPAFIVEHHEYFRNGCGALEEFVAGLYKLEPALSWPTLTTQLTRSCLKRSQSNGSVEVRFFTPRFQLVHREPGPGRFFLSKHEPDPAAVQQVLVDGTSVPFYCDKGFLRLEIEADQGQVRNIEIVDRVRPRRANGFGLVHNTGALLRRGLSEFRDNTLARHGGLLKVARGVAKGLKVTGDA